MLDDLRKKSTVTCSWIECFNWGVVEKLYKKWILVGHSAHSLYVPGLMLTPLNPSPLPDVPFIPLHPAPRCQKSHVVPMSFDVVKL